MVLRVEEMLLILLVGLCLCAQLDAELEYDIYSESCPQAEDIVRDEVEKAFRLDEGVAAGLVRMHFHDAFVRGADGSVLIDSTANNTAEKDSPANNPSLRGFEVIDRTKARLEAECKETVSCADILAFAARDSVFLSKGLSYRVPAGRRDGRVSLASETFGNLPAPSFSVDQLTQAFAAKNLTQEEMVTLSGAHSIGRSHCTSFSNRLYNFNSSVSQDPTVDKDYADKLQKECPQGSNLASLVVPIDPTNSTLDSIYYVNILKNRGLFTSDQTLLSNSSTASEVSFNARFEALWRIKFAAAMVKMGKIGVLTGSVGEIRLDCRKIN